jgi:hypothetical protein
MGKAYSYDLSVYCMIIFIGTIPEQLGFSNCRLFYRGEETASVERDTRFIYFNKPTVWATRISSLELFHKIPAISFHVLRGDGDSSEFLSVVYFQDEREVASSVVSDQNPRM